MQELVLSKILPGQDKDLAQDICILGGYEGLEEFILTDDKTLVQVMSDITENKKVDVENFNKADLASLFARNTFVSADYMAVYNTKAYYNLGLGDGKSIPVETMAKNNFLKALYGYSLMTKKDRTVYNNSILAISALDLYQFTHKKGYLDFALYLESNNKIDDSSELKDVAYHAFFVKELSTIFGQESFKEVYRLDVDRLINKKFDGKGYAGNTFDKGAFSDKSSGDYNTYLNGLVVGLLCDQL